MTSVRDLFDAKERESNMARRLSYIIGAVVAAVGVAMLPALLTSLIYQEWNDALGLFTASFVTVLIGFVAWRMFGSSGELTKREGFAAVGLAWIAIAFVGTLPYLFTGTIANITDAFFESAAGFTTTGSSVIPDPSQVSHGVLVWRSLTQWFGGMGIIVLSIAILPLLGVGGVQLAQAESPGVQPDRLTPRFRETARRLWFLYVGFTAVEIVLLVLGDRNLFQAINHSLTTMSTGGFGTEADSMGGFSAYSQWVVIIFMLIAGTSFALHYRGLRNPLEYGKNSEFRLYMGICLVAGVLIAGGLINSGEFAGEGFEVNLRNTVFTVATIVTTTGFGNSDFGAWVSGLQILIVGAMFLGGMGGSTSGSVKTFRVGVLFSAGVSDLRRIVQPRGVHLTRFGKDVVKPEIVQSVQTFFMFYMFIFMTGTFLMGLIESSMGAGVDIVTSASAVASAIGNIGPGLGEVGPAGNYLGLPGPSKWLLAGLMIAGRLEIFPIVLLFTRRLWTK